MPKKIKYIEETHQYFIGKKEVPSVSKLVSFAVGDSYTSIPLEYLQRASEYGTAVHEAIQTYEEKGEITQFFEEEMNKYLELKKKYLLEVEKMEQIVTDGKNFGGRYDILDTQGILWDIKTTSKQYVDKWRWQLGFYYLGMGKEEKSAFVLYLPKKGKAKVILIEPHTNEECKNIIQMYNDEINNSNNERVLLEE